MNIDVIRDVFEPGFTLGRMLVNGRQLGYTCEDVDRQVENPENEKIPAETAMPRGTFKIQLSFSHRFQKVLPEIIDVPRFKGVRVHGGNTAANTEGCVLLGAQRTANGVANCAGVMERLIVMLEEAESRGETSTITVGGYPE